MRQPQACHGQEIEARPGLSRNSFKGQSPKRRPGQAGQAGQRTARFSTRHQDPLLKAATRGSCVVQVVALPAKPRPTDLESSEGWDHGREGSMGTEETCSSKFSSRQCFSPRLALDSLSQLFLHFCFALLSRLSSTACHIYPHSPCTKYGEISLEYDCVERQVPEVKPSATDLPPKRYCTSPFPLTTPPRPSLLGSF
jgi:hypothetical protein